MPEPRPVRIPLINPNEPEARLAGLRVAAGDRVEAGQVLCTLETTKATQELAAETGGYIAGLRSAEGDTLRAGEILCYLADTPDWSPPAPPGPSEEDEELPPGVRLTRPGRALAQAHGLDLGNLPAGPLLTEAMVRQLLPQEARRPTLPQGAGYDPTALVVYGGGGHGKSVIELLRALETYRLVGVVDDGLTRGESVLGLPVLGGAGVLEQLTAQGVRQAVNAVGGIGDVAVRVEVFARLAEAGFTCPAVVHPTAFVEASAQLSPGVQVFPFAYVGSAVTVGFGAIVNTGAIVSHDCTVEEYANLSPGAILAGGVRIGAGALIGMGVTLNLNVEVGAGARVGNGATVKDHVPDRGLVRAGAVWPS